MRALSLRAEHLDAVQSQIREEFPSEACGVLLGRRIGRPGPSIEMVWPAANLADNPRRAFELDPRALIEAHRFARSRSGFEVLGYYHSHPAGLCRPSMADLASVGGAGEIWLILCPSGVSGGMRMAAFESTIRPGGTGYWFRKCSIFLGS